MKFKVFFLHKTDEKYLQTGIDIYKEKLQHYIKADVEVFTPKIKASIQDKIKEEEGVFLLSKISKDDFVILLDERGKTYSSMEFSSYINDLLVNTQKNIVWIIGGPYGFSQEVYQRADAKVSLSKMTFSHQMVRLFLMEQLYRAFSILKGQKYHHE